MNFKDKDRQKFQTRYVSKLHVGKPHKKGSEENFIFCLLTSDRCYSHPSKGEKWIEGVRRSKREGQSLLRADLL